MPGFLCGLWELNLGPRVCSAGTLTTGLSPELHPSPPPALINDMHHWAKTRNSHHSLGFGIGLIQGQYFRGFCFVLSELIFKDMVAV